MKLLSIVLMAAFVCGCASLERNAYIAIGGTTTAVELARQAYVQHENTCHCVTQSEHDKVQALYVKYQAAMKVADDAIVAYKGASVPDQASLNAALTAASASASDVIALIEALIPQSESATLKTKMPKVKGVTQ